MARITKKEKNDPKKLDEAVGLYGLGKSTREIEKLTGINNRTVAREAKRRGMAKGVLEEIVADVVAVEEKMSQLPANVSQLVADTAEARKKQIEFFNRAALDVMEKAAALPCADLYQAKAYAQTTQICRDSVLGKAPEVAVQINNTFTLEDLLKDVKV